MPSFAYQLKFPGARKTEEQVLMESLFEDYEPAARPVYKASQTVQVQMGYRLMKIDDLVSV